MKKQTLWKKITYITAESMLSIISGGMGTISITVQETAEQSYRHENMRASKRIVF